MRFRGVFWKFSIDGSVGEVVDLVESYGGMVSRMDFGSVLGWNS